MTITKKEKQNLKMTLESDPLFTRLPRHSSYPFLLPFVKKSVEAQSRCISFVRVLCRRTRKFKAELQKRVGSQG